MAYFPPYIDAAGLHLPSYQDIYDYEWSQFTSIYGSKVDEDNSDADVQWVSVFSLMINDAFNAAQLAYNARSPLTAVGADLDSIVKINGIARLSASPSNAVLTISGRAGTTIRNGVAQDQNGYFWFLPLVVIIPPSGSINVSATCETTGAISALAGTINIISTPTGGWNSVVNSNDAVLGSPTESDSELRGRQGISVALSSKTLLFGTISAIAGIAGVTRYAKGVAAPDGNSSSVENPTGGVDYFGNPAHSITMVVEGGSDNDIATAIYNNKSIGCYTNGTTTVPVTDPNTNNVTNINFYRPTYDEIFTLLVLKGLTGFTSATAAAAQIAVNTYLNSLQIGESLARSSMYGAALSVIPNLSLPTFSVQQLYIGLTATSIGTFSIATAGSGYVAGDVVFLLQGGATGGQLTVKTVGSGGMVTSLTYMAPGSGYTVGDGLATSGGAGTGLTVNLLSLSSNGTTDITIAFNAVAKGDLANVVVQVV